MVGAQATPIPVGNQTLRGRAFVYALPIQSPAVAAQPLNLQGQELIPAEGQANRFDRFGSAVAISPETNKILVGAYNDATRGLHRFPDTLDQIQFEEGATVPAERENTHFGNGAVHYFAIEDDNGPENNAVPAFTHAQKLLPNNPIPGENFGYSVALRGNMAVVGAPAYGLRQYGRSVGDEDIPEQFQLERLNGSAYVFVYENEQWRQIARLSINPLRNGGADMFGASVAITDDHVFIGAPHAPNEAGQESGYVYVYKRSDFSRPDYYCYDEGSRCAPVSFVINP